MTSQNQQRPFGWTGNGAARRLPPNAMDSGPEQYKALEGAIDAIAASYESDDPINNLESAALPNKRRVIEALDELESALYMGFYTTRSLSKDNLRHALAEHLYRAHDLLLDQVNRALTYEHWSGRCKDCPEASNAADVVLELFHAIPELRRALASDLQAAYDGDPAAESIEEIVFSYPSIRAVTAYRIAHQLHLQRVPMIPRILTQRAHELTGIDIHPGATIGDRFFIDHGTGVVIGQTAIIGNNVKLYQGVTLGALSVPKRGVSLTKRHPTLEANVTVYAGATILGGETVIGSGSTVGANVWVVDSVPPGTKVFGRKK